jgi:hypothetical protein
MDKPQTSEMARAETEQTQVRNKHSAAVADEDVGHMTTPVNKESQLAACLTGQIRQAPGRLR